ncbi:MAG: SMP-30/gluconolactonase/LRE family protein, partial [Candidatus Acidiferrum sp.]
MNRRYILALLSSLLWCAGFPGAKPAAAQQEQVKGVLSEPADAAEVRAQIANVEKLLPALPDRGAALYFLAASKQHLGETREALALLKECIKLREGFDPSGGPEYAGLKGDKEFNALVEQAHRDFPAVSQARTALVTEEKDLIPEGLAFDERQKVFYLSSLYRRKIVKITPESRASDFVPADKYGLLPVLGIRPDPSDGSVWANCMDEDQGRAELLHFDAAGKLLGRFAPSGRGKHGFNDLVVRKNGDVIVTDSLSNQVFRFDPHSQSFAPLAVNRPLFYPNGIALADDDRQVFVADDNGVVRIDMEIGSSGNVAPGPHNTLGGIDGLYWHKGSLVAVQNAIGSPRIVMFRLSKDGLGVTETTVLEYRSQYTREPTTGAIRGNDFYFIV